MLRNINSILPDCRTIVLFGHDLRNDLRILKILGFDFPKVAFVLDTIRIANNVLSHMFHGSSL